MESTLLSPRAHAPLSRPASLRSSSFGFTLIELLTVIAIIGILAAIIIPVVGKVRETAKFSISVGNLRSWTTAAITFANDNKGFIPHQGRTLGNPPNPANGGLIKNIPAWYNALPSYVGNGVKALSDLPLSALPKAGERSVWVCPNFQEGAAGQPWLSYGPSAYLSNTPNSGNPYITNLNALPAHVKTDVSRLVLFGETTNGAPGTTGNGFPTCTPNVSGDNDGMWKNNRWGGTSGKSATGMADGSVRTFTSAQLRSMGGANGTAKLKGENPLGIIWQTR
jgi:prepilin-type N-terminal cleavage/methylation domain-containing protein